MILNACSRGETRVTGAGAGGSTGNSNFGTTGALGTSCCCCCCFTGVVSVVV